MDADLSDCGEQVNNEPPPSYGGRELHLHVSGAIGASLVPWWTHWLRQVAPHVTINVSLSENAQRFVSFDALSKLANGEVWLDTWSNPALGDSWRTGGLPQTECFIVFPATLDTVMRLAGGRADSPAMMMLQITDKPIIIGDVFPTTNSVIEQQVATLLKRENVRLAPRVAGVRADSRETIQSGFNFPGALAMADALRTQSDGETDQAQNRGDS